MNTIDPPTPIPTRPLTKDEWAKVTALLDEHPAPWGLVTVRGGKHQLIDARLVPIWTFPPEAGDLALFFLAAVGVLTGWPAQQTSADPPPDDPTPERTLFDG